MEIAGGGFKKLLDFEGWRIARNGYKQGINDSKSVASMGRHMLTKEVFVLLEGEAFMLTAGNKEIVGEIHCEQLKKNQLYTVDERTWHFLVLEEGGLTLIVENSDTSVENSDTISLTVQQIEQAAMIWL